MWTEQIDSQFLVPEPGSLLGGVPTQDWSCMMSSAHPHPGVGRAREGCWWAGVRPNYLLGVLGLGTLVGGWGGRQVSASLEGLLISDGVENGAVSQT